MKMHIPTQDEENEGFRGMDDGRTKVAAALRDVVAGSENKKINCNRHTGGGEWGRDLNLGTPDTAGELGLLP